MTAEDALIDALVTSGYDLTGDGRIGWDNSACREAIVQLARHVIDDLERRGYVITRTAAEVS
jgi:hypothetical protein